MIRACDFRFAQNGTSRECSCRVEGGSFPDRLVFEGEADALPEFTAPSGNFALLGLLYPAMALGEDLEIDATVSPALLYSAQHDLQSLLIAYRPELRRIKVSASSAKPLPHGSSRSVATGFSAGVDTFATLALFTADDIPEGLRLRNLTTFDVGAMGPYHLSSEIFEKYSRRVRDYSRDHGFAWQTVRSNLELFYSALNDAFHCRFASTHVIRNAAAAFAFEDIYSCFLYSSSYPYEDINTDHNSMGFLDPIILPLLSTETLQFKSAGAGLARHHKTELISSYQPAMKILDTCVDTPTARVRSEKPNCSRCWKCVRTMVNLDALDRLDDFSEVYDVDYYRSNKERLMLIVYEFAFRGKPTERDLLALLRERGFDPGVSKVALTKLRYRLASTRLRRGLSTVPGLRKAYRTIRGRDRATGLPPR